jgi:integrase
MTPTELLNQQLRKSKSNKIEERTWAKNLALEFCRDNPDFKNNSDSHARFHWNVIKMFFDSNEVPLSNAKNPLGRKVARRKNNQKALSREDCKRVLTNLNPREKAIALCMIQSGMGIGEILDKFNFMLPYVQERIQAGQERIRIDFPGRKNNPNPYFTYISKDAVQQLRLWLMEREKWVRERNLKLSPQAKKAIFISKTGKPITILKFEKRFNEQLMRRKIKTEAYGIVSHMLRKVFKTESSPPERSIDYRAVEFMLGHINGLQSIGGTYDKSPQIYEKAIEKEYQKLEPYINILSQKTVEEQGESQAEAIEELKAQNERLATRLDELSRPLGTLKDLEKLPISLDLEKTSLGTVIQLLRIDVMKGLKEEVQKLKEQSATK